MTTKKTAIKHKLSNVQDSRRTECGRFIPRYTSTNIRTNKTWKGVTCQRCLAVKAKQERVANATKAKRSKKTLRRTTVGTSI